MENNTTVAASTILVLEKFGLELALVWLLKFWFTVSKKRMSHDIATNVVCVLMLSLFVLTLIEHKGLQPVEVTV